MTKKCFLLLWILSFSVWANSSVPSRRYPVVTSVHKEVKMTSSSGVASNLKVAEVLKEKVTLTGSEESVLRVDLSEDIYLVVKGLFGLEIPFISQEYPHVSQVKILDGSLRIVNRSDDSLVILSDLSETQVFRGDYQFDYIRSVPQMTWTTIEGSLDVKGLEHESSARLITGQRATFTGELDLGKVVYDVLLKGRRVARGRLSSMTVISEKEMQNFKKDDWSKSTPKKIAVTTTTLNPKWICKSPYAEAFQCRVLCEDGVGIKQLCNANGQWGGNESVAIQRFGGCPKTPKLINCSF